MSGKLGLISFDVPNQVLEFINAFLFVVCLAVASVVGAFLVGKLRRAEWKFSTTRGDAAKLAWSLTVFYLGDSIIRGPVWYMRHMMNHGVAISAVPADARDLVFTTTVGTVLCGWAGLCALRAMSPARCGEWLWVSVLMLAVGFASWAVWV